MLVGVSSVEIPIRKCPLETAYRSRHSDRNESRTTWAMEPWWPSRMPFFNPFNVPT